MVRWKGEEGVVVGDWDADGAVSTAIVLYLQSSQVFPLEERVETHVFPSSGREVLGLFRRFHGCPRYVALLDLPYTPEVQQVLERLRRECSETRVVYVDHHLTSLENLGFLREHTSFVRVGRSKPTSLHLVDIARERGKSLPSKLKAYAEAVGYIELGRRPPPEAAKVVELMASISRALKLEHSREFWEKMVRWMANPLPIPLSRSDQEILERVKEEAQRRDEELEEAATSLAIGAEKVGCFRFIDARRKWKRRGVTSLATRISRNVRAPVALLAKLGEDTILVIRTRNNAAKLIGDELVEKGLAVDVGGHGNLAVVKLRRDHDLQRVKQILLRSCRFVA